MALFELDFSADLAMCEEAFSSSDVDLDLREYAMNLVVWTHWECGSGSRWAKFTHEKREKVKKCIVVEIPDVLFCDLGVFPPVAYTFSMEVWGY
jgi:hypothetical protein